MEFPNMISIILALICAVVTIIYLLHKYLSREYGYFEAKGIPFSKPMCIFGSRKDFILRNQSILTVIKNFYDEFPNHKMSGIFDFGTPVYVLRDPQLIKQLTVKYFDHFVDRKVMLDGDHNSVFARSLSNLCGQKWKDMRVTLSPAFTGCKMRQMFDLMNKAGQQFTKTLTKQIQNGDDNTFEFEILSRKFTVDVIVSCALGFEVNSLKNPKNEFFKFAMELSESLGSFTTLLKVMGYICVPKLMSTLKIELFSDTQFFEDVVNETMRMRERLGIIRPDLVHMLMQARKGQLSHELDNDFENVVDGSGTVDEPQVGKRKTVTTTKWVQQDFVAQCFMFFLGGFDSTATMISFIAYELMANADCQTKLQSEIDELNGMVNGKPVTYDQIQGMKYMDQVVFETLRKWPTPGIERLCTKEIELECDGKKVLIEKGSCIMIPSAGLHFDEQYFPNAEKFDPERFNEENRKKIVPNTYLPFGIGPRNCIGSRFALMELKTFTYHLLLNFNLEPSEKTQIPLRLKYSPIQFVTEKGNWIKLTPRSKH